MDFYIYYCKYFLYSSPPKAALVTLHKGKIYKFKKTDEPRREIIPQ